MISILLRLLLLKCCIFTSPAIAQEAFSFHLLKEPHTLDPALVRGASGNYLFSNVYRSLFVYSDGELRPEGARKCTWKNSLLLVCHLNPEFKWSNGKVVTAQDYVRSWRRLFDSAVTSTNTEVLINLKNARSILKNKLGPKKLGVSAPNSETLRIEFSMKDPEFIYKLTSPSLSAIPEIEIPNRTEVKKMVFSGPYTISKWDRGKRIYLSPNPHYWHKNTTRPNVEVYLIEDDQTAIRLFQGKTLKLLRRIPAHNISDFKNTNSFFQTPMARFDYLGFGPELKNKPHLRKALSLSLRFSELQKIYESLGKPGCPSLPENYGNGFKCHDIDLVKAKSAFEKVKREDKEKTWKLYFSRLGGDDHIRGMQWIINQWQNNLGLKVILAPTDQGSYINLLETKPPALFRKGVTLDRPTCLAATEVFTEFHSENYMKLSDKGYGRLVRNMARSKNKKADCSKTVNYLTDNFLWIPMGQIHFSMTHDGSFKDWSINELNQLDLTFLSRITL